MCSIAGFLDIGGHYQSFVRQFRLDSENSPVCCYIIYYLPIYQGHFADIDLSHLCCVRALQTTGPGSRIKVAFKASPIQLAH